MKICSKEMAAIVFGAGSPSGFIGGGFAAPFASPAPQQSSTMIAALSVNQVTASIATGAAMVGNGISNAINGNNSFQNQVAGAVGLFTGGLTTAVSAFTGLGLFGSTVAGGVVQGVVQNHINEMDPNGIATNLTAMGDVTGYGGYMTVGEGRGGGFNSSGGGSAAGCAARGGMGFGGTGSGIGGGGCGGDGGDDGGGDGGGS
jgi:hypothetical protein